MRIVFSEEKDGQSFSIFAEINISDSITETRTTMFRKLWGIIATTDMSKAALEAEKMNLLAISFEEFSKQILFMEKNKYRGWKNNGKDA